MIQVLSVETDTILGLQHLTLSNGERTVSRSIDLWVSKPVDTTDQDALSKAFEAGLRFASVDHMALEFERSL